MGCIRLSVSNKEESNFSKTLARQIKSRRNELGLTIEESAPRADVRTKAWSRYEAGRSIRKDKCKGICKALNWHFFPGQAGGEDEEISIQEYKKHGAWSRFLENTFGNRAAMAFAAGSDILLDHIKEDMSELASMPAGSHIGQPKISWLYGDLPEQFLTRYDYDFLYQLKCALCELRARAKYGASMEAYSVMEELLVYLCNEESTALIELSSSCGESEDEDSIYTKKWVFDLFDDMNIIRFLYSDVYLAADHPYHVSHWNDQKFYIESTKQACNLILPRKNGGRSYWAKEIVYG